MYISNIIDFLESWAPSWTIWENDNCGLQVGDAKSKLTSLLITLDVTNEVVNEAIKKKVQLIISHHPLIFRPIPNVTTESETGKIILQLAKNNISLYTMHTNLDAAKDGVSFALARALDLKDIKFLSPLKNLLAKIVVYVPEDHSEKVIKAMANAGAGIIGEYSFCSYRTKGTGTFKGSASTNPFLGKAERLESVEEVRLEMVAERSKIAGIISEMKRVHPYEEVAYDIYNVETPHSNYGMGAIGVLSKPQKLHQFLLKVKRSLSSRLIKYNRVSEKLVQKVAVCGGSGSTLINDAIKANADVFITADIKYHTFQMVGNKIVLVDAGHWETENVVIKWISKKIKDYAKIHGSNINVFISKQSTNPVFIT